jgi:ligand-binding sensor protein
MDSSLHLIDYLHPKVEVGRENNTWNTGVTQFSKNDEEQNLLTLQKQTKREQKFLSKFKNSQVIHSQKVSRV